MDSSTIIILILLIPLLIVLFFLVKGKRKSIEEFAEKNGRQLRNAVPQKLREEEQRELKKNWILPVCGAFLLVVNGGGIVVRQIFMRLMEPQGEIDFSENIGMYITWKIADIIMPLLGILTIVLWVVLENRRLRNKAEIVRIPACVVSTFRNTRGVDYKTMQFVRTAHVLYFDYKKGKFRGKTVTVNQYEKQFGVLGEEDVVSIAVEKCRSRVRFVCLLQEEPQGKEKESYHEFTT